jgi:hypothetical protein
MTNKDIITRFVQGATTGTITRHNAFTGQTHTPLFIEGDTLFSYGHHYPLARRVDGGFWVNGERYSTTTSKHASLVRSVVLRSGSSLG